MASKAVKREELSQILDTKIFNGVVTDKQLIGLDRDFILSCKSALGDQLTESEKQVCSGLFFGLSAKEIGKLRDISHRTVESHIANIRRKNNGKPLSPIVLSAIFLQLQS
jgi:DNA-binding CsgD family transcriptional regulator